MDRNLDTLAYPLPQVLNNSVEPTMLKSGWSVCRLLIVLLLSLSQLLAANACPSLGT
jgi:hypothetical protein